MLPRFEIARRLRPLSLIAPGTSAALEAGVHPLPMPAPYAAAVLRLQGPGSLTFRLGEHRLSGIWEGKHVSLTASEGLTTSTHRSRRSRRHGACAATPTRLALTLTGSHLTALVEEAGDWVARATGSHRPGRRT